MKTRYLMLLLGCLFLQLQSIFSQTENNSLYIPPTDCAVGSLATVPIMLSNDAEIVALQFDMHIPDVVRLADPGITLTDRKNGHTITVKNLGGNNYRVLVFSATNTSLRGNSGALFQLPLTIPKDLEIGAVYAIEFKDVVLSKRNGENVQSGVNDGSIKIVHGNRPDIAVQEIKFISSEIKPGGKVSVAWSVKNVGNQPTKAGWSEQVYLVSEAGDEAYLGQLNSEELLSASGVASRQAEFMLPAYPGIDGKVYAKVKLTPYPELGELSVDVANNEASSSGYLTLAKELFLKLNRNPIAETYTSDVYGFLNRSGSRKTEETFTFTNSNPKRMTIPSSVTIPVGESGISFKVRVIDDQIANPDSFIVAKVSGNGYKEVSQDIWIEDNEMPKLTVTAPEDDRKEGDSFKLTIQREWATKWPLAVRLVTDHPKRFQFDPNVVIPANEKSVTVDILAIDDDLPDVTIDAVFTASAYGFGNGTGFVNLLDNDLPDIQMEITPLSFSESAGPQAAIATLRRTKVTDNKITVKLTDDSKGTLYYPSTSIVLEKGVTEYQFAIGVVDNDLKDGDRKVKLTAAVYISSCSCSAAGSSAGSVTKELTILDNDGPSLKITSSQTSLIEGKQDATILTISRNTDTSQALTVNLTCDKSEEVTFANTVVIPAGKTSVDIPVSVKENSTTEGNRTVTFTVSAEGFSSGVCWAMITDQTLPDAMVTVALSNNEYKAQDKIDVEVKVENKGAAALSSQTKVSIYLTNNRIYSSASYKKMLGNLYTQNTIKAGGSETVKQTFTLPNKTGDYYVTAVVNEGRDIVELIDANNISTAQSIMLKAPYTVSVLTDKSVYKQGESIVIDGVAVGNTIGNALVELYFINEGVRNVVEVITDSQGKFQYTFKPENWQMGYFSIGACFPDEGLEKEMAGVNVYGIRRYSSAPITCEVITNQSYRGEIQLVNPGKLSLTNVTAKVVSAPAGSTFKFEPISQLDANSNGVLKYSIIGSVASEDYSWEKLEVQVSSKEGANLNFFMYYYCRSEGGVLVPELASINTTMTKGKERDYQLNITNTGKDETGKITVNIPDLDWMRVVSVKEIPSMKSGEKSTILLRLIPTEKQPLNNPLIGEFSVSCTKGKGFVMPFKITPVSESTGTLIIDVCDEYTYNTKESPHVEGAKVRVTTPANMLVSEGVTGKDGLFRLKDVPEGYYIVEVTEARHSDVYKNIISVAPEMETMAVVNLSFQGVKVAWEVVETEITDEYEIVTTVDFDTNVPVPIVMMDVPERIPADELSLGESLMFNITLTNKGLITAKDVQVGIPSDFNTLSFELMVTETFDLLPQSSMTIPVKVTKKSTVLRASSDKDPCMAYISEIYYWLCGDELKSNIVTRAIQLAICNGGIALPPRGGSGGSGWLGGFSLPVLGGPSGNFTLKDSDLTEYNKPFICKVGDRGSSKPLDLFEGDEYTGENGDNDDDPSKLSLKLKYEKGYKDTKYFKNHAVRGIAADGVSVLRVEISKIPAAATNYVIQFLSNKYGQSEEVLGYLDSYSGSIDDIYSSNHQVYSINYNAPSEYPISADANYDVGIKMYVYDASGKELANGDAIISIIRTPVLMIHGLNSDMKCFAKFKKSLLLNSKYENFQLRLADYSSTNCDYFKINKNIVNDNINYLMSYSIYKGYIASKADLIGHSMGGILSRIHVQYVDRNSVHKVITLNTPHSGSQGANLIMSNDFYNELGTLVFGNLNAVSDLQIGSSGMDFLNDESVLDKMNDIPVHAVATTAYVTDDIVATSVSDFVGKLLKKDDFFLKIMQYDEDAIPLISQGKYVEAVNVFLKKLYNGESTVNPSYDGLSDWVVAYESQLGGLRDANISSFRGNVTQCSHTLSPDYNKVHEKLQDLLLLPSSDNAFSMNGFRPTPIKFVYSAKKSNTSKYQLKLSKISSLIAADVENIGDRKIKVKKVVPSNFFKSAIAITSQGISETISFDDELIYEIPSNFKGTLNIEVIGENEKGEIELFKDVFVVDSRSVSPLSISFIDSQYGLLKGQSVSPSVLCTWSDGTQSIVYCGLESDSEIISLKDGVVSAKNRGKAILKATFEGLSCQAYVLVLDVDTEIDDEELESNKGVCSSISLQFKQTMTMTRQAFRGTLTVFNGHESIAMKDVRLNLEVKDEEGNTAGTHEFQINTESLDTFGGELDGAWTLDAQKTGKATILFIPTKYAAPTEEKNYSFGGTLSYVDPFTNLVVTRDLFPVTMTVKPSPNLDMTYFMQRDILGDDPLTTNKVEPMVPAEFSLLIHNTGAGDATNVNMVTNQPEIIDNEKGLNIKFELLSSQLNGEEHSLALGGSVVTAFGTIEAGKTAYAQWWFTSTLLGHFTDYDVKATHVSSYDNPDLSLLDQVTIHELIRSIKVPKTDLAGFLVNDNVDSEDLPDMLYLSDGTIEEVAVAKRSTIQSSGTYQYTLTVIPSESGWNYGSISDPTNGRQTLVRIVRKSDGASIDTRNIWQTSCTLRDGKEPFYENIIHFVDKMGTAQEEYQLTFEPGPSVVLEVSSFEGIPAENETVDKPVTEVTVHFNKEVNASTFTTEDLTLVLQGETQDASLIKIQKVDDQTFVLDLTALTKRDGYYILTVQTADITDAEGFEGDTGKSVNWVQYLAAGSQTLTLSLSTGWNWISTNMEKIGDPITFLSPVKDQVKRLQNQFEELTNDPKYGLTGNLKTLTPKSSYKLEISGDGKIDVVGTALTPDQVTIDLNKGWNWIGYIPRAAASPTMALSLLSANANDEIKGQRGFAKFNGTSWVGTLKQMAPGEGYMYYANTKQSFRYAMIYNTLQSASLKSAVSKPTDVWSVDIHKYPNNMSIVADLWDGQVKQEPEVYKVGAFVGEECRGIGQYVDGLLFITVYGEKSGEKISFRAISSGASTEWGIRETVSFGESSLGTLDEPYALHLTGFITGTETLDGTFGFYPNPVSRILYFKGDYSNIKSISVLNINGVPVLTKDLNGDNRLDVSSLSDGVYILMIKKEKEILYHKIIKVSK